MFSWIKNNTTTISHIILKRRLVCHFVINISFMLWKIWWFGLCSEKILNFPTETDFEILIFPILRQIDNYVSSKEHTGSRSSLSNSYFISVKPSLPEILTPVRTESTVEGSIVFFFFFFFFFHARLIAQLLTWDNVLYILLKLILWSFTWWLNRKYRLTF